MDVYLELLARLGVLEGYAGVSPRSWVGRGRPVDLEAGMRSAMEALPGAHRWLMDCVVTAPESEVRGHVVVHPVAAREGHRELVIALGADRDPPGVYAGFHGVVSWLSVRSGHPHLNLSK